MSEASNQHSTPLVMLREFFKANAMSESPQMLWLNDLEEQLEAYRAALTIIATTTYPARYLGRSTEGVEMYGGSNDASDFAQQVLASNPASSPSIYEGTPKPHGIRCWCDECMAENPANRHFDGTAAQAAAYQRVHEHYASDPAKSPAVLLLTCQNCGRETTSGSCGCPEPLPVSNQDKSAGC